MPASFVFIDGDGNDIELEVVKKACDNFDRSNGVDVDNGGNTLYMVLQSAAVTHRDLGSFAAVNAYCARVATYLQKEIGLTSFSVWR